MKKLLREIMVCVVGLFLVTTVFAQHSIDKRVDKMMSQLTVDEKISFLNSEIPGVNRLGIKPYIWYAEALHGLIAWNCTSFPQNNAMGSTWNPQLEYDVANAISDEVRALYNSKKTGKREVMMYSPTVNMSRDPRWGRNEECYSEDPYLMATMGRMFVRGMQGNDPKYLKTVCTVKHFVCNNVEHNREQIFSNVTEKELRDYYFSGFRACVNDGAQGIMMALNGINGIPCSANEWLMNDVLRKDWGFKGYIVADWNAVGGVYTNMHYKNSLAEGCAAALKAGCDQECFRPYPSPMVKGIREAYKKGLVSQADIDKSVKRLLRLRFLTGEFDDMSNHVYAQIPKSVMESPSHLALAQKAAEQSIVLLKNENNMLPLKKNLKKIAVIGPFADRCWLGIYSGFPRNRTTPVEAIRNICKGNVVYAKGCEVVAKKDTIDMDEALKAASDADVVIAFVGNDDKTSTENTDRKTLNLPGRQEKLLDKVCDVNKNVIVVIEPSGSTIIGEAQKKARAIVCSWANGEEQGVAIARVLFGDVCPGGKLNTTWYADHNDLPAFNDYNISHGFTYMYNTHKPLYPFGYGLSYTKFKYSNLKIQSKELAKDDSVFVSFDLTNIGNCDGDEVVQLYVSNCIQKKGTPIKMLKDFMRVHLKKGELKHINLKLYFEDFAEWNIKQNTYVVNKSSYEVQIGTSSSDISLRGKVNVDYGKLKSNFYQRLKHPIHEYQIYYKKETQIDKKSKHWRNLCYNEDVTFKDPGYFVSFWNGHISYTAAKKCHIKVYIEDSLIGAYDLQPDNDGEYSFKIPIPTYGDPQRLQITSDADFLHIKDVKFNFEK